MFSPRFSGALSSPGTSGVLGSSGTSGALSSPRTYGAKKNCRGPGGHPVHVPGRFEAAASPSCCALGDARRGSKVAQKGQLPRRWWWIDAPCHSPRPEASDTPVGALGAALYTYQVGFMQPPPRRLCPGRCTRRVKSGGKKRPITPPLMLDRRSVPPTDDPRHLTHLPGPWEPPCEHTRSI